MLRGLYTSASSMLAREAEQDVLSNNLANADTTGFKKDFTVLLALQKKVIHRVNNRADVETKKKITKPLPGVDEIHDFQEKHKWREPVPKNPTLLHYEPFAGVLGTGVMVDETKTDFSQGNIVETGSNFDFALNDNLFFELQTPTGLKYTRAGQLKMDDQGRLVNNDGYVIRAIDNGPINIGDNEFRVDDIGNVYINRGKTLDGPNLKSPGNQNWTEPAIINRIKLVKFKDQSQLDKYGLTAFSKTGKSGEPETVRDGMDLIKQGFLEKANINIVKEMVKMIEVMRAYESNQKAIQAQDTTLKKAVSEVGRVT